MTNKILTINDCTTDESFFLSDNLKEFIKDNINDLLNGMIFKDLCFAGELKTLELNNNMQFILKPQEE